MSTVSLLVISAFLGGAAVFLLSSRIALSSVEKLQMVSNGAQALSFIAAMIAVGVTLQIAKSQSDQQSRQYTREFLNSQMSTGQRSKVIDAAADMQAAAIMVEHFEAVKPEDRKRTLLYVGGKRIDFSQFPQFVADRSQVITSDYEDIHRYIADVARCIDEKACDEQVTIDYICGFVSELDLIRAGMARNSFFYDIIGLAGGAPIGYQTGQFGYRLKYMTENWSYHCDPFTVTWRNRQIGLSSSLEGDPMLEGR